MDFTETAEFPRSSRIFFFSDRYEESVALHLKLGRPRKPRVFVNRRSVSSLERPWPVEIVNAHGSYYRDLSNQEVQLLMHGQEGGFGGAGFVFVQLLDVLRMEVILNVPVADFDWRGFPSKAAKSMGVSVDRLQIIDIRPVRANVSRLRRLAAGPGGPADAGGVRGRGGRGLAD